MITSDNTNVAYVGDGAPAVVDNQLQPVTQDIFGNATGDTFGNAAGDSFGSEN